MPHKTCGIFIYRVMRNVRYDYSSCHIELPKSLATEIVKWGREKVNDNDIYVTHHEPNFGREDEMHITILYGIHAENSDVIRDILEDSGPIEVELGKIDVFTNPFKFDVVMIEVNSDDLCRLNEKLQKSVKHTSKYPTYKPHVTIAYVKKGKGWKHHGLDIWNGTQFTSDYAIFSSKDGTKERIAL